jgi:predicted RNA-binding Zn ribbon-like protein
MEGTEGVTKTDSWSVVGGHVVLDLVNTVAWRRDTARRAERIRDPQAVVGWAGTAGLLDAEEVRTVMASTMSPGAAAALEQIQALRDAAGAVLDAYVDGNSPDPVLIEALRARWQAALSEAAVEPSLPLRWTIRPSDLTDLAQLLALSVGSFLQREDLGMLKRCGDPACGWLFLDTTRNHSRRWCDSKDCGNRARVRRHQARAHGPGGR